jgi:soluble lytic murein transglycosylase-like protein
VETGRYARKALVLAAVLTAVPASAGELYRRVDARGVVHFTDAPRGASFTKIAMARPASDGLRVFAPSKSSGGSLVLRRSGARRAVKPRENEAYDPLILLAAERHGVPAALVKAVIAAESSFDPGAVSPKGAMGLMQLMPGTAKDVGVEQPFDDEDNVHGGTRYLRWLFERYGDWLRTVAAYNAGPEAVERYGGVPPYRETREYVQRVLSYYRAFHDDFAR